MKGRGRKLAKVPSRQELREAERGEKIALIYARVSTNRQEDKGHSLDSQSALLAKEAEAQGYRVELVLENGSGRNTRRPLLNKAIQRLNKGEAHALYVLDIDRLARSARHLLEIAETAQRRGWRLVISTLNIDTSTSQGKMSLTMFAGFAEFESGIISDRVKRQHQARRERGVTWGVDEGPTSELEIKTRRQIIKEHRQGKSLREIARGLEAKKVPTARGGKWEAATIRAILLSPASKALVRG
jgi:DNA invertase Pin-like site-specific DNA recombinase